MGCAAGAEHLGATLPNGSETVSRPVKCNERHPQELDPEPADWLQPHRSSVERLQPVTEWGVDWAQPILAEGGTPPKQSNCSGRCYQMIRSLFTAGWDSLRLSL
jgi:hypothetical protein